MSIWHGQDAENARRALDEARTLRADNARLTAEVIQLRALLDVERTEMRIVLGKTHSVQDAYVRCMAERDRLTAELATARAERDSARQAESWLRETLCAWEEWSVDESDSPSPDAVVAMLMRERDELRAGYIAALRVLMARTEERDRLWCGAIVDRQDVAVSRATSDSLRAALAALEAAPHADRPALVMSTHGSEARRRATLWAVVDSSRLMQNGARQDESLGYVTMRVPRPRYDAWGEAVGAVARLLEEPEDAAATRRLALLRRLVLDMPRCQTCGEPATCHGWCDDEGDRCDAHAREVRAPSHYTWSHSLVAAIAELAAADAPEAAAPCVTEATGRGEGDDK